MKFPVFSLYNRELAAETSSLVTTPSAGESVLTCAEPHNWLRTPHLGGGLRVGWDVRRGQASREPRAPWPFFSVGL